MSKNNRFRSKVQPKEVGVDMTFGDIDPVEFNRGYQHGLASNKLICFRKSFRLGFRKAKLELRELRNTVELPQAFKANASF